MLVPLLVRERASTIRLWKKQNIKINIRINISIYQFIKVSVIRVNINRFCFLGHIVLTSHVPLLPCCLTPAHNMLKGRGQLRLSNQSIIHYKKYVRYNIYISHENNIKSSVQYRFFWIFENPSNFSIWIILERWMKSSLFLQCHFYNATEGQGL